GWITELSAAPSGQYPRGRLIALVRSDRTGPADADRDRSHHSPRHVGFSGLRPRMRQPPLLFRVGHSRGSASNSARVLWEGRLTDATGAESIPSVNVAAAEADQRGRKAGDGVDPGGQLLHAAELGAGLRQAGAGGVPAVDVAAAEAGEGRRDVGGGV